MTKPDTTTKRTRKMAISENFKRIASIVRNYVGDTYDLLNLTSAMEGFVDSEVQRVTTEKTNLWTREVERVERRLTAVENEVNVRGDELTAVRNQLTRALDSLVIVLVPYVLANETIMGHMYEGKKINAIKELRRLTGAPLRQSKEAVEHAEVRAAVIDHNEPLVAWKRELIELIDETGQKRNAFGQRVRSTTPLPCGNPNCEMCYSVW